MTNRKYFGCLVPSCNNKHYARCLCQIHYERWLLRKDRSLPLNIPLIAKRLTERKYTNTICRVPSCSNPVKTMGLCSVHYSRNRQYIKKYGIEPDLCLLEDKIGFNLCGANNTNWKGGISEYPNHSLLKKIRLQVLEKANYVCQQCGGKATEVHHIDKTKTNHSKENLMPVCHRCNALFHRDKIGRPRKYHELSLKELAQLTGYSIDRLRRYFMNLNHIHAYRIKPQILVGIERCLKTVAN